MALYITTILTLKYVLPNGKLREKFPTFNVLNKSRIALILSKWPLCIFDSKYNIAH